jgi:hypothetical protein
MAKLTKSAPHIVFVSPTPDKQWKVKSTESTRADSIHATKTCAVERGRELSRNKKAELVIQKLDGKIGQKDSYGNDPRSVRG